GCGRTGVRGSVAFPDDVEDDILEIFIFVMAMGMPAGGTQINFHIAGTRRHVINLQDCVAKIRPAFDTDKSRMKHADRFPVGSFKLVAPQSLMLPDGLEQTLGWRTVFVVQHIGCGELRPPGGVEIFGWRKHFLKFLRLRFMKVKPPDIILNATNGGMGC
ncbi:MAG TPA: hypothetical protein VK769_05455, partial [Verrucomicrobiae bacterium]|nr:hypothetical protein [Verrucomicrobiae bacterium]